MSDVSDHPLVAPCRTLPMSAPIQWLKLGIKDALNAPLVSFSYGVVMALILLAIAYLAWRFGSAWIMLSMLCAVVFIAPVACIGTYAVSAQLERNQRVTMSRTLRASFSRYLGNELVFTLVLLVVFLIWARATSMVSIFLPNTGNYEFAELGRYLAILIAVSLLFLAICFATSVFALPMIMHRDVDAITAVITSINAVLRNKLVMALWALMIALLVLLGLATAGLGLVVLLPIIGHAVWHGYLDTIDARDFPLHKLGITAERRSGSNRSDGRSND